MIIPTTIMITKKMSVIKRKIEKTKKIECVKDLKEIPKYKNNYTLPFLKAG